MLLSKVFSEMGFEGNYKLFNERDFQFLALTVSKIEQTNCTFVDNEKFIDIIGKTTTMVLTSPELFDIQKDKGYGICTVENPREVFFEIHNYLADKDYYRRGDFKTQIGENCNISEMSSIPKKNVIIGNNVTIEDFVALKEHSYIGDNTIISAGSVIGGVGYEFKFQEDAILSVAHLGGVVIGENVEIQNNTCVDRAVYPWDDTIIGDFCKIDNLVHIAHAVKLEKCVMVVANSGIGGRVVVGQGSWIGFGTTIRNGIELGKKSRANMGAVVTQNIPDYGSVSGNFAVDHKLFIQNMKAMAETNRNTEKQ